MGKNKRQTAVIHARTSDGLHFFFLLEQSITQKPLQSGYRYIDINIFLTPQNIYFDYGAVAALKNMSCSTYFILSSSTFY